MEKIILGLDLGTNSVGWSLIEQDFNSKQGKILGIGSRIIPMSQDILGNFDAGNSISQTAERTNFRGTRRLYERCNLRRERLHRVLNILGFLPKHYAESIDFVNNLGKFIPETETKLPWVRNKDGKFKFLFQSSFDEMLNDFKANGQEIKIPYDWTIYYLRKKALTHKILKEELAWIILNFNTKRGYYQLRGEEEEEMPNKSVEFHSLKIIDVVADEKPNSKGETWYSLHLENGWIYRRSSKNPLYDWKDKVRDFIVTTDLNDDGTTKTDKDGNEKRSFRAPNENDWTLLKKKTEADIEHSQKTVGAFIYEALLQNPTQKIRGKLVRTIERKFYKEELLAILKKQIELQPELFTEEKYYDCVRELYRNNTEQQSFLSNLDFIHLFVNDIIFYQRPLRSQKSSIGNCSLEFRIYKDKNNNTIKEYLKGIPKSNPYYQEFRLWQWLYNLKIYNKDNETEVTTTFITNIEDLENLFDFLNNRKDIEQNILIKYLLKQKDIKGKNETDKYRWNYVEDKKYPCNETHTMLSTRLAKVENVPDNFLEIIDTKEFIDRKTEEHGSANLGTREYQLWHIIYSVTDKKEYEQALRNFAIKYNLETESFVENFKKFPPFKSEYGSYSEKAIKKLLPLMRIGKYWKYAAIDENTKVRISKIITGEYDEKIKERVREKAIKLTEEYHFQGLHLWLSQYIVYDRHSEAEIAGKWKNVTDLEEYLNEFKQHSLRNPIVEQVITETLRVVRDIWKQYGHSHENFFDEIHIELGREMKNTSEERKKIANTVIENENTNLRIKALLAELQNDSNVENVRPYSPIQQEILKIYEEYAISNITDSDSDKDFIIKISKTAQPSSADLQRYKLWLEQRYRSPYTGQIIPLGKLFTSAYEIEHIIPQSRYFDNSLSNKVICEAAVNKKKDRELGLEFIKNHHGEIIETGLGQSVKILEEAEYMEFVNRHYSKNRSKKTKLLLEEIPDKMIERQMNDTRYISKFISALLSNIVRADSNDDGINSKNVLPVNGKITTILKQDWGLNDIWNDLILPRFERMNQLTETSKFTAWNEQYQKFLPTVPLELSKGFQKKRIDHRHHAMDALVIACVTRDHINLLNNQSAKSENSRHDLQRKLRYTEKWIDKDGKERYKFSEFKKPWDKFTVEAKNELSKIIVSFKQNLRIINKATNKYSKYKNGKKIKVKQEGLNWAIRKPLHKETVYAQVSLRKIKTVRFSEAIKNWRSIVDKRLKEEIKHLISLYEDNYNTDIINKYFKDRKYKFQDVDVSKVEVYYFDNGYSAVRESLNTSFNEKKIKESVTDTAIQKILLNYLSTKGNNPDLAFSPEGIEEMNKNIIQFNNGKFHQPIIKVRVYETIGKKFAVGKKGNKKDKYVEAAKGTNLFFAIYTDESGNRSYETVPLNIVIERMKQGLNAVPNINEKGYKLLFHLSPNDLVYVPTEEDIKSGINLNDINIKPKRIYKMVSSTGNQCMFVRQDISTPIINKMEFSPLNKMERAITGEMIKDVCIKLIVDRLGNIKEIKSS
ncbi:type II CRISPR RNA-guided endonuclease Cas9 [Parabacteroides sp. AF17-28]|uniref:type II CRISPR RNA-guided endonuclease Cas9 n=1 Tax=Parabacteroides sp. AF17-28 TaxID=2292241 RepID=UPI000EFFE79B|nr:type II CRISPR RNA-guided endonuclease Cas9 [Parabacteroides sp. AF17-28]RHR59742.1 type II CRISPR RNA-guided endonuclease Cas9 [Parabacteroides sp. AF17-28]